MSAAPLQLVHGASGGLPILRSGLSVHSTVYSIQSAVCTVHCALCTLHTQSWSHGAQNSREAFCWRRWKMEVGQNKLSQRPIVQPGAHLASTSGDLFSPFLFGARSTLGQALWGPASLGTVAGLLQTDCQPVCSCTDCLHPSWSLVSLSPSAVLQSGHSEAKQPDAIPVASPKDAKRRPLTHNSAPDSDEGK